MCFSAHCSLVFSDSINLSIFVVIIVLILVKQSKNPHHWSIVIHCKDEMAL